MALGGVEVARRLVRTSSSGTPDERIEFAPRGFFEIGRRNLETLVAATLEATLLHPTKSAPKAFLDAAAEISELSFAAYRALVYDTEGFTEYFFDATPIREIAELNIGHFLIGEAVFTGLAHTVTEMRAAMHRGRARVG